MSFASISQKKATRQMIQMLLCLKRSPVSRQRFPTSFSNTHNDIQMKRISHFINQLLLLCFDVADTRRHPEGCLFHFSHHSFLFAFEQSLQIDVLFWSSKGPISWWPNTCLCSAWLNIYSNFMSKPILFHSVCIKFTLHCLWKRK